MLTTSQSRKSLSVAVCWRPVPARAGEEHIVTRVLRKSVDRVVQTQDAELDWNTIDVVLILENCNWFPRVLKQFKASRGCARQPLLVVWHWEPLSLPKAAGLAAPRLSLRELAKIVLRDDRATDVYTNFRTLRRLGRQRLPDLLIVSSQAWKESLAERGIASQWVPIGYYCEDGAPLKETRDIEALFLGSLQVPRRRRIVEDLRRRGVNLAAVGSWFNREFWGESRTRLINRAQVLLNIQRYPGEVSAHRLILGMANKSLVVSEPIYRPEPFVPGEHYVEAEVSEMPRILAYYRSCPNERAAIVDRAYRYVTEQLKMESSVAEILSMIDDLRAQRRNRA